MFKKISVLLRNRTFIYALILVACLANGIIQTAIMYDAQLGLGDNSTFYAFTRNIANGEVMYKDFIHFRTPGSVTMFGFIMHLIGQQQTTIYIASMIETNILYPLIFLISAMILFRKKSPWLVAIGFLGIAFIPGVAQLRAAVGLLTIAVYTLTFDQSLLRKRTILLLTSGALASLTFIFGQEIAMMVGVCIVAAELCRKVNWAERLERAKYIAVGALAIIVPLLLYISVFSNIKNFLYYTLYYSFVVQPKFMDLPFPSLTYTTLMYYLPFIMYLLCFLVLYTNKKLGIIEGLLLSFGILRLITAVGRSDIGHLLFSIPEVFIIVPYFVTQSRFSTLSGQVLRRWLPYGIALALCMYLATHDGIALALAPFIILFALYRRMIVPATRSALLQRNFSLYLALGSTLVLFVYILTPTYITVARSLKIEYFANDQQAYRIGGVKTDEITYNQIKAVENEVQSLHPNTVFAFPIQPFYYSLADHHASRFLTFEPQTTVSEQEQTIQDLERTKPEVIIFDPLQAHGLSGSLWKISEYITTHYEIKKEIANREILWVMVPKKVVAEDEKLAFRLYKDNPKTSGIGIQSTSQGLQSAVGQTAQELHFTVQADTADAVLKLSVANLEGKASCGWVKVSQGSQQIANQHLCVSDGEVAIPLKSAHTDLGVTFQKESELPVIWNNVRITVPSGAATSE
jgi:hypothetical protein